MRSRASMAPAIATIRIDTTPSRRSINTDATASTPPTPSFDSPYARTASPPTLAGRNVPTNVLTKKTRITVAKRRTPAGSSGASSVNQRYAINTRSIATRTHASRMNRQSAPRAACHTAEDRSARAAGPSIRLRPRCGRRANGPFSTSPPQRKPLDNRRDMLLSRAWLPLCVSPSARGL